MSLETDFKTVLIVVILGFIGWYVFIHEDKVTHTTIAARVMGKTSSSSLKPQPPEPPPTAALAHFLNANAGRIFSPLEDSRVKENAIAATATDLLSIQSALRTAHAQTTDEKDRLVYAKANHICQQLQNAIAERKTYIQRLTNTRNVPSKALSNSKKNDEFFIKNIKASWVQKSKQLQQEIQKSLATLRDLERNRDSK